MHIQEIPRDALEYGFRGARLPLTVAGKLLARGDSNWPPALMFDKVEAGVKAIVGRVARDETLQSSARLQRADVTKREEAMAERARAGVEQQAEAQRDAVEARDETLDVDNEFQAKKSASRSRVKATAGNIAGNRKLAEEGELQQANEAAADEVAHREAEVEQAPEARPTAELESDAVEQARLPGGDRRG